MKFYKVFLFIFLQVQFLIAADWNTASNGDDIYYNDGNVGIGTTSPGTNLDINNPAGASWTRVWLRRDDNSDKAFFQYKGDGDGTILGVTGDNPIRFYTNGRERVQIPGDGGLQIKSESTIWSKLNLTRATDGDEGYFKYYGNGSGVIFGVTGDNPMRFHTNNQERMKILEDGGLEVKSESSDWSKIKLTRATDGDEGYLKYHGNGSGVMLGVTGDNPIRFNIGVTESLRITSDGKVGIGLTSPTEMLQVNGNIKAKKVIVTQENWPDYVFKKDYELPKLEDVEKHIEEKQHLPEVPSAKEAESDGVSIGDMQKVLLKKIEELTLYAIKQEKRIQALENQLSEK